MNGVVVDTSAVVAILTGEPAGTALIDAVERMRPRRMSAATVAEVGIVLEARYGPIGFTIAERFIRDAAVEVVPVDYESAGLAVAAWRRFGRGRHPAALNFGDCFTYALAEQTGDPILCTGGDFAATGASTIS